MSAFLCIATLLNSNIPKEDIIKVLNRVEINILKQYSDHAKIYRGSSTKSKKKLIEMILYGFICDKIIDIGSIYDFNKNDLNKTIDKCNINKSKLV